MSDKKAAESPSLINECVTPKVLEHRAAVQTMLDNAPNRRKILRTLGIAGAAGMTTSGMGIFGPTTGGSKVALSGMLQAVANELASL